MDEKTRNQKKDELLRLQKKLQTTGIALEEQRELIETQLNQKMLDAVTKVAKQQKLDIVFSKRRGVLYADKAFDVTQDIIQAVPKSICSVKASDAVEQTETINTAQQ